MVDGHDHDILLGSEIDAIVNRRRRRPRRIAAAVNQNITGFLPDSEFVQTLSTRQSSDCVSSAMTVRLRTGGAPGGRGGGFIEA